MQSTRVLKFASSVARNTPKYPRPRPGTSERPAYHAKDPLVNNPNAAVTTLSEEGLTFIHLPPPTAPTPFSLTTAPASPLLRPPTPYAGEPLPPLSRSAPPPASERLPDSVIEKIRELRTLNPEKYTRGKLAKRFKCTQNFVGLVAPLKGSTRKVILRARDEKHELRREKWSEKHAIVKAISKKRRELW